VGVENPHDGGKVHYFQEETELDISEHHNERKRENKEFD
jgi:hypothetical protein